MSDQPDLVAVWEQAKQTILTDMGDFNRSLWEAANLAQPIALDGDVFALGVPPGKMSLGSHLTSTATGPLVRTAVESAVGRPVQVELVEGTDPGAWERELERREARAQMAERSAASRRAMAGMASSWADLYEEVARIFGATRDRRFATSRAAMMAKALLATAEVDRKAHEEDPGAEDLHRQQLNRTLERIALLSEAPATLVAVEYLRVKSRKER